jgi:hypothetical protein
MKSMPPLGDRRRPRLALLPLLVLLAGCASAAPPREAPPAGPSSPAAPTLACTRDAQCVVKDVGNCCGYYPACVHVEQPVGPEGVRRECREKGLSSICGFPAISACACVEGECRPTDGAR